MQRSQCRSVCDLRHGSKSFLLLALLCVVAILCAETVGAATFTASLDRSTVTLGESVTLSLTFEGASPNDVPSPPAIPNLQIRYIGPTSQFSFVNGQTSSTVTHNFQVTPRQVGEYTIPSLTVTVNGQRLSTQPLRLTVLKPNAPSPEAVRSGSQIAFMKLVLPKKQFYLGEPITAELQIYFRNGVQNYGNLQFTSLLADGFTVSNKVPGQRRRVQIGNAVYTIVPIYFALAPIKTGPLKIGPIATSMVIQLLSNRRRADPFEQFGFPGFFNQTEQRQITLATEAETVQSLPLPADHVPLNFNGAVGNYTMTVSAGPTNVATGDPITVHVQISGHGALDALTLPAQPAWKDFKTYPPTTDVKKTDQLGLQGTKTFEEVVSPESTNITELPPFSFSFFDPDAKAYRTLTHPAVALKVRPGGNTPTPVVALKNSSANQPPPQDIVAIKTRMGSLAQIGPPLALHPWFVAVQTVPALAFLAAFVWRKRTDSLANNPRLRRQRKVAQIIRSGLAELRAHAAEMNSDAFFATVVRLLQEQIGERLDCPASAITEAVVDEKLRLRELPDSTVETLHELFQAANLARYAPVRSEQELVAIVPKLETALHALRQMKS